MADYYTWSERFWLPRGLHWSDMPPTDALLISVQALVLACLLVAARYFLTARFLRPLAFRLDVVPAGHGDAGAEEGVRRFCESVWRSVLYSALFLYGASVLADEQWFTESDSWLSLNAFREWPTGQRVSFALRRYYTLQLANNLAMLFDHVTGDVRLSDHHVMLAHHVVAVFLLGITVQLNAFRVGLLGMLCTDLAPPFADAGKALNYARCTRASMVMALFLLASWFPGRIIAYPCYTLYAVIDLVVVTGAGSPALAGGIVLLAAIYAMQLYWTVMLYNGCRRLLSKASVAGNIDPRNDRGSINRLKQR